MKQIKAVIGTNSWGGKVYGKILRGSYIEDNIIRDAMTEADTLGLTVYDLARDDVSKVALHIDYINYDEPDKNIFKVINQYSVQGEHLRRRDTLLFINGIPIAIFEFKTAIEEDTTIHDAWKQITIRYGGVWQKSTGILVEIS